MASVALVFHTEGGIAVVAAAARLSLFHIAHGKGFTACFVWETAGMTVGTLEHSHMYIVTE